MFLRLSLHKFYILQFAYHAYFDLFCFIFFTFLFYVESEENLNILNTSTAVILHPLRKVRYSNSDSDDPSNIFVSNRDPTRSFQNKSGAANNAINGPSTSGTFFNFKIT